MPVYAFHCGGCGSFDLVRPMADASGPAACPDCGRAARRLYTPPGVARMAAPLRRALDGEARSAHDPAVVREKTGRAMPHLHEPSPSWAFAH